MKIRAQIGMVLNLDKCIGCHTCSVTCKNVWTSREGVEYAWFILAKIFANPDLPEIDDYYEPFDFDYAHLQTAPEMKAFPTARPRSKITGQRMEKIEWGPNWEEILGGEFEKRSADYNFEGVEKAIYGAFEQTFMMYLPRLCEHCLNPTCVAACPSGAIYKREEDGIVLIDQDKCRGWRMCVSACPYKKVYYNWESGKSEKCTFCYPRIEVGQPTVCSETCVGRIRYLGVLLYDADKIEAAASTPDEKDLYQAQLDVFLDPNDPAVIAQARLDGIPEAWLKAAQASPVYKMAMEWKVAFPLHPEYRTLPMVWYVPPLSPIQSAVAAGALETDADMPDVSSMRIPVRYLANMLTAGKEEPVVLALERMMAMRKYMRAKTVEGVIDHHTAKCTATWRSPITRIALSSRQPTGNRRKTHLKCAVSADLHSAMTVPADARNSACSAGTSDPKPKPQWSSNHGHHVSRSIASPVLPRCYLAGRVWRNCRCHSGRGSHS